MENLFTRKLDELNDVSSAIHQRLNDLEGVIRDIVNNDSTTLLNQRITRCSDEISEMKVSTVWYDLDFFSH